MSSATSYSAVPKAVFSTDLNDIATSYFKRPDLPKSQECERAYARALLSTAEALMIAPRVSFKVEGENVVLAALTRMFGAKAVMELLESGVIEFILWRGIVTQVDSEDLLAKGISPLAAGNSNNAEHSDPATSAFTGVNWVAGVDRKNSTRSCAKGGKTYGSNARTSNAPGNGRSDAGISKWIASKPGVRSRNSRGFFDSGKS